jgi:membrane-bound serine protease (ClpP class)
VGLPLLVAGALLAAGATPALAAPAAKPPRRHLRVVQVTGPLDPVNVDLLGRALRAANRGKAAALIVQLDSPGALDADARPVIRAVAESPVPVVVWVGPKGAQARGAAAFLLAAAPVAAAAPGTHIGPAFPLALDGDGARRDDAALEMRQYAVTRGRSEDVAEDLTLHRRRFPAAAFAAQRGLDLVEPTLGGVIVALHDRTVVTAAGSVKLSTARVVHTHRGPRRQPNLDVRFAKLSLGARVQHALIGPSIAYLLLVLGLALIVFEFFAVSVGLAGVVGAAALTGALFGFSHLPVHWWGVALVVVGLFGFAVDVQAAVLGFWTGVGVIAVAAGGLTLYGGSHLVRVPIWTVALVTIAVSVFMLAGMTSVVRARFSTPTVGREGMIGQFGEAQAMVDPDGIVAVHGALWRARTNRATPIRAGDRVRVVAVDGPVLEVEPETGGAREFPH